MNGIGRFRIANNRRLRTLLLVLVAVFATGLGVAAYGTHLLRSLDLSTVNTRFSIRGNDKPPSDIVIVAVDDNTLSSIKTDWPYPRAYQGKVIDKIGAGHPKVIASDIQYSQSSTLGQNDDIDLLTAANNFPGKTVFSFTQTSSNGGVSFLGSAQGTKLLGEVGAKPANGGFPYDPGDVVRRFAYSIGGLQSFAVVTAETATHKKVSSRKFRGGSAWIDYLGPSSGGFPVVSYSDVYYGKIPTSFWKNKIVLIGATASVLQDIHPTSTGIAMPGPEIQANAVNTVLRGFPLSSAPGWLNIVLVIVMGLAVPLASLRLSPIASVGFAIALGAVFAVVDQLVFSGGTIISFVYPIGTLILAGVGSIAVQLVTEAFERIRTRDLFSRFVPENVVDELLASSDGLRLGGVQRAGTVMFTDLRGFTSFAESLEPSQVIDVLNHYLSEMSDAILNHGGTLVAYMGDGIFAVFGAPLEMADHADRALATAREMLEVRLPRFNQWIRDAGLGDGFRMGIGLNSGNVMSGHVGSERRVEYAAVGDTTNTSSRLESMTKGTPHQLFLSGSTQEALTSTPDDLIYVDEVEIRGRVAKMKIWSIKEPGAAGEDAAAAGENKVSEPVS